MSDYISRAAALDLETSVDSDFQEVQGIIRGMALYAEHIKQLPSPWIPVEDGVPDTEEYVLVCTRTKSGKQNIRIGYYIPEKQYWATGMNSNVTHWMPLPDPPGGDQ